MFHPLYFQVGSLKLERIQRLGIMYLNLRLVLKFIEERVGGHGTSIPAGENSCSSLLKIICPSLIFHRQSIEGKTPKALRILKN